MALALLLCSLACAYTDAGEGDRQLAVDLGLGYAAHQGDTTTLTGHIQPLPANVDSVGTGELAAPGPEMAAPPTVTLHDPDTRETLSTALHSADFAGYHRRLQIRVESPQGSLTCQMEGPGRHTLLAPLQGEAVAGGQDLQVRWQTPDGIAADEVEVQLSLAGFSVALPKDTGTCIVPAHLLRAGSETVTVTRRNRLQPRGGAASSEIRMDYTLAVTFQVL